ncbi:MAG: hypothetical protein ACI86H_000276 [bacterium]|jgi:hypothetical protein
MNPIFSKQQLVSALQSEQEVVAVWGAYQLLTLCPDDLFDELPIFLNSPFADIQEAGIAKIGEAHYSEYAMPLLQVFRENEGRVKQSAAIALSCFPNDLSISLLQKWLSQISKGNNDTKANYTAALYAFLQAKPEEHLPKIFQELEEQIDDPIKSSILLKVLLVFIKAPEDFSQLLTQYYQLRDLHSDAELTNQLIQFTGHIELIDWVEKKLIDQVPISLLYEECYQLLGVNRSFEERQILHDLDLLLESSENSTSLIPAKIDEFLSLIGSWSKILLKQGKTTDQGKLLLSLFQNFSENADKFESTIPKIKEMESVLILSLPLIMTLDYCLDIWLQEPQEHFETIAHYYNSSILTTECREQILELFFSEAPKWSNQDLIIKKDGSPIQNEKHLHEILWSLYRGEFLGYNIPWPAIFPNPEQSLHLVSCLHQIYYINFEYFLKKNDQVSIDYAMQLFQLKPTKKIIDLLINHFNKLYHNHADVLLQTIEYIPAIEFLPLLENKYQEEEYEVAEIIQFICEIFEIKPNNITEERLEQTTLLRKNKQLYGNRIRLYCSNCHSSYKYPTNNLYVDEDALDMNPFPAQAIWVKDPIYCKRCQAEVRFQLDAQQLEEIRTQAKVDHLLRLTSGSSKYYLGQKIYLIPFPKYEGKSYTPEEFEEFIQEAEKTDTFEELEKNILYLELTKVYEVTENYQQAFATIQKVAINSENEVSITLKKGIFSFHLQLFAEARELFKTVIKTFESHPNRQEKIAFIQTAKKYLNLLNTRKVQRSQFKVIQGKQ